MNITVLTGSAHKNGTSALLADRFIEGAEEAGHAVTRFDTAFLNIRSCTGCGTCEYGKNPCVFDDDMTAIAASLKEADLVVFVTPLYYHMMSSSLKAVVDRFFGINDFLYEAKKKGMILVTAGDADDWNFDGIKAWYKTDMRYLGWQDAGQLYAGGCYTREDIEKTDCPDRAYQMGRQLAG